MPYSEYHPELMGCLKHLLTLISTRLVVTFNGNRSHLFHSF